VKNNLKAFISEAEAILVNPRRCSDKQAALFTRTSKNTQVRFHRMEFNFQQSSSKETVLRSIENLNFLGGNTQTGAALQFLQTAYDEIEGIRSTARKVRQL